MIDSTRLRHAVAQTWAGRYAAERVASRRYALWASGLERLDAPAAIVQGLLQASVDEQRHAYLCLDVARAYGWSHPPADNEFESRSTKVEHEQHNSRLLLDMLGFCCIAETLNASLLLKTLEYATAPQILEAVRTLLADEIRHGQLGWMALRWHVGQRGTLSLQQQLIPLLQGLGTPSLFEGIDDDSWPAELVAHGELSRPTRREIFWQAMSEVVLRGFDQAEIDTRPLRIWLGEFDPRFELEAAVRAES